jgi:hypothetical protein
LERPAEVGAPDPALQFFKHQIRCVLVSIGRLIFPDTKASIVPPAVELFVCAVLGELAKECKAFPWAKPTANDPIPNIRHIFGHALDTIIPGVFENLGRLAVLTDEW